MKHALAVLAGIAVGLPVMAALASANGHTAGGLPDRYVPWAQHHLHTGYAAIRTPVSAPKPTTVERTHLLVSTPLSTPSPPARHVGPPQPPPRALRHAPPATGLRVSIDAPRTVRPGGTYTYRIRLANRGPGTPGEITVRNTLPPGVERTATSLPGGAGGYADGRDTTLVLPRLQPGRSATARFAVRVRRTAHGDLVARSRIASIAGARVPRTPENAARTATRVR
ncbi:hypothetical protein [Actinomadura sp. DC4]|uniref:hypothetical protein n=1 Tax=Actinomadura sp. DC4 TaxID=3055069 RepID=UPI0025B201E4|nr:hypothetical protein [Actinomadura sp. DC4]MDN3355186.1 hypothetical protein [Actinomadura sp. DC4]